MQSDNLIKIMVGGAIGVLLLVTVALPIVASATETHTTFNNDGYFYMDKVDDTYSETIVWDYTKPTKLTIGTNDIDLPTENNGVYVYTLMGDNDFFLRYVYSSGASYLQLYRAPTSAAYVARESDSQSMTITISGGSINFDNGSGTTVDVTYTDMYVICSGTGDYVMKDKNTPAYLKSDSEIYAHGGSYVTGITFYSNITGNPTDGFTRVIWPDDLPMTAGDMSNDLSEVSGYIGLYTLDKFTYTVTNTNTNATGTVTYSYYVVPASVTVEKAVHFDSAEITMIELIPLLLAVALVLGIIAYAIRARLS